MGIDRGNIEYSYRKFSRIMVLYFRDWIRKKKRRNSWSR